MIQGISSRVPDTADGWLENLDGASWVLLEGRSRGATRCVSVLLHGNEPSGFRAAHRYLRERRQPARDTLLFIGAVEAARRPPTWSHRALPERRDLNRCFLDLQDDQDGLIAKAYLERLTAARPEALIDLHNNTGHNPAYGVLVDSAPECVSLVESFAPRAVVNSLRLGTLIEAWRPQAPSVVIECGQAGDPSADDIAFQGLCRYLEAEVLPDAPAEEVTLYRNTVRFTIREGLRPVFANHPEGPLTLRTDLERYNFRPVDAGTVLGWYDGEGLPLAACGQGGVDYASSYIARSPDGALRAKRAFTPIMMTTNPDVVLADCLCYLVSSDGE